MRDHQHNPIALVVLLVLSTTALSATDSIRIFPSEITLHGHAATQQLRVVRTLNGEVVGQPAGDVTFESDNPAVVAITNNIAVPKSNGSATITARLNDQTAAATVRVVGMAKPHEPSFRNHVLPVFAKAGCNSGACHGALAGKGGFRLSLRGYDPGQDYFNITREARGRRIELADPGRSLILAKPSGAIAHKGGLRFEVGSREYEVIAQWLAAGAQPPREDDAKLQRVEVLPPRALLKQGETLSLLVRAHYSDGRVEDVTRWARFASTDETVARVDEDGHVTVIGSGEGAITAWFSSQIAIARVTSPFENDVAPQVFAKAERRNFIDEHVLAQLKRLNLPPSPPAPDHVFLRRAYLDSTGTLPTAEQVRAFLADASPDKRDKLIDELLASPQFIDYWTYKWSDILLISGRQLRPPAVKAYYEWTRKHVEANTPWNEFVRLIITAQGSSIENGATNFYALHQSPEEMTENVSQAFLGLSIGCAKCHNHPLEKWTNDQYYAMANLFSRVRAKGWGGDARNGDGLRTLYVTTTGELVQPRTGKPQPPTPLDGQPLPFDATQDRREALAEWLTSPQNPYFARAIVNRVWANYFGVGLVESVDDLRATNPASNEALLAAASRYLVDQKFDLKALMREILRSATYQRAGTPLPGNKDETRYYSRYYPRRMMAEVMLDAVSQVTDVPSEFNEIAFQGADKQKTDFYPKGTRAIQLFDSAVASYFLNTFGRNPREITCECERSNQPSMVQVLHLSNGDTINDKLAAKGNRVEKLLGSGLSNAKLVEEIYLTCLSRLPTQRESRQFVAILDKTAEANRRDVVEDVFWALMTSREFLFHR